MKQAKGKATQAGSVNVGGICERPEQILKEALSACVNEVLAEDRRQVIMGLLRMATDMDEHPEKFHEQAVEHGLSLTLDEIKQGLEATKAFASHFALILALKPMPELVVVTKKVHVDMLRRMKAAHDAGHCDCGSKKETVH